MKVINVDDKIIKSWCENIEDSALDQACNLAKLPFLYKHVALMPDCHSGYGMPIGGVIATEDVVIPNAVGVDIGCGMGAVKTYINVEDLSKYTLKRIMEKIRKAIPVGFNKHEKSQGIENMPRYGSVDDLPIIYNEWLNAEKSLGTLGGGNHFIEIQKDQEGFVWIMIHSGSRNLGFKVANHYNQLAVELNEKWFSNVPKKHELAFLPIDSEEGQDYLKEMQYCVDFALANRKLMMERIINCFCGSFGCVINDALINIAHNYASLENHFGKNVMVHRKGATLAREDTIGIIPGSQGTKSYIVRGLGNPESFESCSHGAGRLMSRTKAQNELSLEEETKKLNDQGIIHSIRGKKDLDEASGAYKDINEVMNAQSDLVEIVTELTPLAVIKG